MQFFDILREYFPQHQLLTSDFHFLPEAVKGYNAPVVQTRYKRRVVPVSTPYVSSSSRNIVKALLISYLGPTRLLRHTLSYELHRNWRHLPRYYWQIDTCDGAWRILEEVGLRRRQRHEERGESDVKLVNFSTWFIRLGTILTNTCHAVTRIRRSWYPPEQQSHVNFPVWKSGE